MAHHKKKRPLNARGHCKMCKFWKINGMRRENKDFERFADHRRRIFAREDARETE
jgi:hypothetical protein